MVAEKSSPPQQNQPLSPNAFDGIATWGLISRVVFDQTNIGILITDPDAKIIMVNGGFHEITGYRFEEVIGKNPRFLHSGIHDRQFFGNIWESIKIIGQWQGKIFNKRKDGKVFPEQLNIIAVKDDRGQIVNYVGLFVDLTIYQDNEEFFQHVATHDTLTNLPNRSRFYDFLNQAIFQAEQDHTKLAVLFVDLDRFKFVNDTYGHEVGDQLLLSVADRLRGVVSREDIISRMGGDEFTIILGNVSGLEDATHIAETVIQVLSTPFQLDIVTANISASVGISIFPGDGANAEELLLHADKAMYQAKDNKKRIQY